MLDCSDTVFLVAAGGADDTAPEESDGMVRKAPQSGQNLALSEVMEPPATKQCESPKDIEAPSATIIGVGEEAQPVAQECGGVGGQRHIDARALFARFATLSTLSTAVAPEHGEMNRLIRSGNLNRLIQTGNLNHFVRSRSHPTLDEPEAPTLDATGLRHVLRGVGLGVPNSTSVRPMLAEFGEVVGCQPRLTYTQFRTLRAALNARDESDGMACKAPQFGQNLALSEVMQPAATKQLCGSPKAYRRHIEAPSIVIIDAGEGEVQPVAQEFGGIGGQRHINARALFARFATLSTLSTAVAPEHGEMNRLIRSGNLNRLIRSGSHPTLDEPEAPTLDATGLRHVLRGVGLGVPNNTSVRPMLAEFGEVVGCQPRLTYAQFETLRAALNAPDEPNGMARKASQFGQNLTLSKVMQPAATKQRESPKGIEAPSMTIIDVGEGEVQPVAQECGGVGGQRHIDARALFARFATLSTLSTAVAPEHGDLNRFIRSGSYLTLDEPEASTLDATGLRHVLRGVGLGVPNSTSVRPMLAEFGEVVGCQPRLTYAQFETLRAALDARVVEHEVTPIARSDADDVTVLFKSSVPSHLIAHIDREGLCGLVVSLAERAEQNAAAEKMQAIQRVRMSCAERAEQSAKTQAIQCGRMSRASTPHLIAHLITDLEPLHARASSTRECGGSR